VTSEFKSKAVRQTSTKTPIEAAIERDRKTRRPIVRDQGFGDGVHIYKQVSKTSVPAVAREMSSGM
jgi:hypothetical protein